MDKKAGPKAWGALFTEANLAFKPYVAIKVYPDEEVLALIGATCRIFKQPKEKVETVSYRSDGISNPPGNENGSPSSEEYAFLKPPMESGELGAIGHYRILHALGKGGMGIVFRAVDVRLKRVVALKILEPSYANEAPMKQRFLREARAMAAIKSEYVISIYEVNEIEEMPFLVMEFLEGSSLETQLQEVGNLPFSQVMKIGKEVCIGLAAAHAKGLIHRDINPSNLWLEKPHGRVKILDFGLARSNADTVEIAKVGEILGTPPFMAPEQAYGNPLDFHTDLFSLGCVLYWLTTGVLPFQAKDDFSTLVALSKDKSPSPKSICKDLPEEFSDLVLWLLEKVPTERPESAMAVFDKLSEIETRMANESKG